MISRVRALLGGYLHRIRAQRAKKELLIQGQDDTSIAVRGVWEDSLRSPTEFYGRCFRYFHHHLPREIREHREYFAHGGRGFGEDAFHVMWFLLFSEFRPRSFLEIGVYRGQILSLMLLLQRRGGVEGKVVGISPFVAAGDSVSSYRGDLDYHRDTLRNFNRCRLPEPELIKSYSTDAEAIRRITSEEWDAIYIDGNHDYDIAKADWDVCAQAVAAGGLIVLDDSGLSTSYKPPAFATKGHPGPSRVASEVDPDQFIEIIQVGHNRVFQKRPSA